MTLKKGAVGSQVTELQKLLTAAGYPVEPDGWFGDATEKAVLQFQRDHLVTPIGQAGPRTMAALRGKQLGNQLTIGDLQAAAIELGLSLPIMAAFAQVEAAGEGFDTLQRPRILFERHIFYKQLAASLGTAAADDMARKYPQLCNPKRGGYQGGATEWSRLQTAMTINRNAAIESASWGMFQIMGFHWQSLGYASAADFMAAMCRSESQHLQAVTKFIANDRTLLAALKARKWADAARRYNGPAYKENRYDQKLAEAYAYFCTEYPEPEVSDVA